MERTTIRGNKALANALGVHYMTIQGWRKKKVLDPAILVEYGRVIIYDLEKVYECLRHSKVKQGRRAAI